MQVIKRDGTREDFNIEKIKVAVTKAANAADSANPCKDGLIDLCTNLTMTAIDGDDVIDIEDIQDIVEQVLMAHWPVVAKDYIKYRDLHDRMRFSAKLHAEDIENQNANVDEHSFDGRQNEAANIYFKEEALNNCMSEMARHNHLSNRIYIHDLSAYSVGMHNCLTCPIDKLLANGFKVGSVDVRPAGSINTAMQLVAVIFQLQSQAQFGGVSASHIDWSMVPYVRKSFFKHFRDGAKYLIDKQLGPEFNNELAIDSTIYTTYNDRVYQYAMDMTVKECHQSTEALLHNLNTLQSRSGGQLPFSSINYGTCTSIEGRMVTKAILECTLAGIGKKGKTSIFPCGIFQVMKGINKEPGTTNYDLYRLALSCTAQRIYPNYVNVDWSVNAGYDRNDPSTYCSTMGCRTYNGFDINGMGQKKDGRGNICPVTIILPTIAMEAKTYIETTPTKMSEYQEQRRAKLIDYFLALLEKTIEEARDMLLERYKFICSQSAKSAPFMYENATMEGYDPAEGIESALKHGTLAVGQLGLAECLQILIGTNQTTKYGMDLAKTIESLFKDLCKKYKEEYKLNFGVYYTPAESLCYTAMKKFKAKYGIIPNVSDREYFTNSIHVPVWEKMDGFTKIDIESQLTGYSNAGCITYVEMPANAHHNIDALEKLVNYAMDKDIPYFAINVPDDRCIDCGAVCTDLDICPECGSTKIARLKRVTGYITGDYEARFNFGKYKEAGDREKHFGYEVQ